MRIRVEAIDVHSECKKDSVTLLVMRPFLHFLGASRARLKAPTVGAL